MTDSTRTSARKGGKGLTVGIGVGAVLTEMCIRDRTWTSATTP